VTSFESSNGLFSSGALEDVKAQVFRIYGFFRFASGLKNFLREPISVAAAEASIRAGMLARERSFLDMTERAIFANRRSPYLKLLRGAGCELGDIQTLVRQGGVEHTLRKLLQAGIYITFREFKGRTAAVRGSQTLHFREADFDNPWITPHFRSSSGGTGGRPTRILIDLDYLAGRTPLWTLWFAAHDLLSCPLVFLWAYTPGTVNLHLICAKFGKRFVKWFCTAGGIGVMERCVATYVHSLARRAAGFPKPDFLPPGDIRKVGDHLLELLDHGARPCVMTSPSSAIRICLAMQTRGCSLRNVTFLLGGEPLTRARRETIDASGAKAVPTYGFSEGGTVGMQCPNPAAADDVHISLDAFAVIPRARHLDDGTMVDALLLTALKPASPKVMLNTEIGDHATLETRRCGCLFDTFGYDQHLHSIRSFEKLTGEGVTFVGADLFHVIEGILPKRFGGTVTDYQLVEEQNAHGGACYSLLVSPEVEALDESALVAAFLDELGRVRRHYRVMVNEWEQAGIVHVKRQRPLPTASGKVLPFLTLGTR
jgi:hypothetical protein